jgi:hypothetical protein
VVSSNKNSNHPQSSRNSSSSSSCTVRLHQQQGSHCGSPAASKDLILLLPRHLPIRAIPALG